MDKRNEKTAPFWGFYALFSFPAEAFDSLRARVGNPLREAREARKYLFLRTHFLDEYISGQKRTVRPSRVHLFYARRKRRMNHALHLATKFDSFSLRPQKNKKRKKSTLSARKATRGTYLGTARFRRSSDEIRDLRGSERRGCGEHFLFACRVCSFSTEFRTRRHKLEERVVKKVGQKELISFL